MSNVINELVRSVLQKDSLQDCSVREIEQLADRYPYFIAPHLLLARKLKENGLEESEAQFQKTTLYFSDPLWMDQLLNEKGNAVIEQKQKETSEMTTDTVAVSTSDQSILPVAGETGPAESIIAETETEVPTLPAEASYTEISSPGIKEEVPSVEEEIQSPDLPPADQYEKPVEEMTVAEEEHGTGNETEKQEEPVMQIPSLKIEPIDAATAEFSFQPYHTVDYFASQGIKIRDEERPKDKFGQQLKSFTEWLKILKKVPVTEIATAVSAQAEQKVEQLAEHSVSEREVVTEAMAEVWAKQGNPEKAITIYRKLSLLNPSKSSYFASLIEQIKNT